MPLRHILNSVTLVTLLLIAPSPGQAQRPISLWLGVGRPVTTDSVSFSLKNLDAYGALQLDVPLLPFAFRGDIEIAGSDFQKGRRNVTASAIVPLRLPVVQPYAMLGYGIYDWGRTNEERGVSYGAGVRVQLPGLGFFVQARRHQPLKRSIGTIGIVF